MRTCIGRLAIFASLWALAGVPASVRAGGLELLPGGTRSLARGGAVAARPEDAMGIIHNPAGIVLLRGDQLTINVDVPIHDMCVDPYGYYGWGVYDEGVINLGGEIDVLSDEYARGPLPEVCNSGRVLPLPHIAWVGHIAEDLSLGFGIVNPTVVANSQYGGPDGTIQTEDGPRPTPTRYQLIKQEVAAFAANFAVSYRVLAELQVGVGVQLVALRAKQRVVQNATSGTQPQSDWLARLDAKDYFLPSVTLAVNTKPRPELDFMASFRWVDDFDGSGKAGYETRTYFDPEVDSGPVPFRNDATRLSRVKVGLPWALTVGARYAGLLPESKTGGPGDPLDLELWDIEVDATYSFNERSSKNVARAGEDITIYTRNADGSGDSVTVAPEDIGLVEIDRHLKDSIAVRAGGSFSVVPRMLALHAGGFFETRGVEPSYVSIDSFAMQRAGFGVGAMIRVSDFDLVAGYGHIFQETVEIAPPPHQEVEDSDPGDPTTGFDKRVLGSFADDGTRIGGRVLEDPDAPSPSEADAVARLQQSSALPGAVRPERVINAGKYTAAFDIVSIGAVYHF